MPPRPGSRNGFSSRSSTKLASATGAGAGAGAAAFGGAAGATGAPASDFGASASGAGATAGGGASAFGGSAFGASAFGASNLGGSALGGSAFGAGALATGGTGATWPVTAFDDARASSSCFCRSAIERFFSSSSFCRSLTFFSRSVMRLLASRSALARATSCSPALARVVWEPTAPPAPEPVPGLDSLSWSPPAAAERSSTRPPTAPAADWPARGPSTVRGAPASFAR